MRPGPRIIAGLMDERAVEIATAIRVVVSLASVGLKSMLARIAIF